MKVFGLSGKSGTGKSYNAMSLCGQLGIESLIDDGLFLHESNIIAGSSAKKQVTKIGAVKTALFTDDTHCSDVKAALRAIAPESILILGTSDEMVRRIAQRLELPQPERIIHIEDITTAEQRKTALSSRKNAGTHVIPAPTFEVKKQFSGYFVNPKRSFKNQEEDAEEEKTIVRPTYSYMGKFEISEKVIGDISRIEASRIPEVYKVLFATSSNGDDGCYIRIVLQMRYDGNVRAAAEKLQRNVADNVSRMTAFNVLGVEVELRSFKFR